MELQTSLHQELADRATGERQPTLDGTHNGTLDGVGADLGANSTNLTTASAGNAGPNNATEPGTHGLDTAELETGADVAQVVAAVQNLSERVREHERTKAAISEMQHRLLDSEENERQRLAQELHDGPLQELHCLDFKLVAMARLSNDQDHQSQLMEMRSTLRQVARHLRAICQDLRPPALTPFGVSAVIRSFAETFQQEHPDLEVELDLEDDGQQLEEHTRLTLYRISQHALRNVAQHAEASRVFLSLHIAGNQVELCIEDNGQGFALPDDWLTLVRAGKYGLLGCVERAEAIGGYLYITAQPGRGVRLLVRAPVARPHLAAPVSPRTQPAPATLAMLDGAEERETR